MGRESALAETIIVVNDKILVVIPSVRNPAVISDYSRNATDHRFPLSRLFFVVLTEDHVEKSGYQNALRDSGAEGLVLNQTDRDQMLADLHLSSFSDLIPRRSHAETSFGVLYLHLHPEFAFGIFIDDDTAPLPAIDYFGGHVRNLDFRGSVTAVRSESRWTNVLWQSFPRHGLYPRGYPYAAMKTAHIQETEAIDRVVLSQGLWTNIPDLDAVRILMDGDLHGQSRTRLTVEDYQGNFSVPHGCFTTVCSMNLAFARELAPAFYQFKMDDNPWAVGRFDDIWAGVVAKKVIDQQGWAILNGNPLCQHNKAERSTFRDLKAEANGLEANEWLWMEVDGAPLGDGSVMDHSQRIAEQLSRSRFEFLAYSGQLMTRWVELIRRTA